MAEKRPLEPSQQGTEEREAQRPRLVDPPAAGAAGAGADGTGAAAAPPGVRLPNMEALAKAKRALQLRKEIMDKMKAQGILPAARAPGVPPAGLAPTPGVMTPQLGGLNPLLAASQRAAQIAASFGTPVSLPGFGMRPPMAAGPPGHQSVGFQPPPLRLVAGREVDAFGNIVPQPQPPASLRVNQQYQQQQQAQTPLPPVADAEEDDVGYDPRLAKGGGRNQKRRGRSTFDFVAEGTFQKQAEVMRIKGRYGEDAFKKAPLPPRLFGPQAGPGEGDANNVPLGTRGGPGAPSGAFDANSIPLGVRRPAGGAPAAAPLVVVGGDTPMGEADAAAAAPEEEGGTEVDVLAGQLAAEPVPEVEWWDRALLATGSYDADVAPDTLQIKDVKITHYVAHPVPIEPPAEAPPPKPQPLKLTKRELKKLRTQRRTAREKEKQELIRQGLLEAAKPKVKISNLSRVLGETAIQNPTELEREVRKQMAERKAAHDDRNLARKLTPAEVAAKKERKLLGAASDDEDAIVATGANETLAAVYRVERLSNPRTRYKVDMNAKENRLSGMLLLAEPFAVIVVEGKPKAIKRYNKLMLRRINWGLVMQVVEEEQEEVEEDVDEEGGTPNTCSLVWQGVVPAAAFTDFRVEPRTQGPTGGRNKEQPKPLSAVDAKQLLQQRGVAHYWDAAAGHRADEAPAAALPS